jgi:hypothetical protein
MGLLRDGTGWLALLVSIAGLGVAAMYLGKVRGAGLLLTGFALQAFSGLLFRLTVLLMGHLSSDTYGPALVLGSVVALAGSITIVVALSGILRRASAAPSAATGA